MRVKRFTARSLPEAMVQVKAELGSDAVILHTTEVKVGGLFGLFGSRMIQVMAAVDEGAAGRAVPPQEGPAAPAPPTAATPPAAVTSPPARAVHPGTFGAAPLPPAAAPQARPTVLVGGQAAALEYATVRDEMADLKLMVGEIKDRLDQPAALARLEPPLKEVLAALIRGGVESDVAQGLVNRVRSRIIRGQNDWADAAAVTRMLMHKELAGVRTVDGTGHIVALVGPTGVGKTTTLAKLAAHWALNQRKRVGLITADTYRIAAVDQLKTYSDIIRVPLEVVYEPADVPKALDVMSDRDIIFVDTAGRSPKNREHMDELRLYLETLAPQETYLVLSMTCGFRDAQSIVEQYLPMGFDRFLFTKWDEAVAPGLIYNVVQRFRRPLSYVTTGQNVPDDIEVADPTTIIRAIVGD